MDTAIWRHRAESKFGRIVLGFLPTLNLSRGILGKSGSTYTTRSGSLKHLVYMESHWRKYRGEKDKRIVRVTQN